MTGGRAVVLGDPGPWLCSGMTGGVVYVRQNPDWNLDEAAVRRRLSKAAKVSLAPLEESDTANVVELLDAYREALRSSGQDDAADAPDGADRRSRRALHRDQPGHRSRPTRTSPPSRRRATAPARPVDVPRVTGPTRGAGPRAGPPGEGSHTVGGAG